MKSFKDADSAVILFEPFTPKSIIRGPACADTVFPHDIYASPLNMALWWKHEDRDEDGIAAIDSARRELQKILIKKEQPVKDMMLYPNYAGAKVSIEELYGPCLPRAKEVRKAIDPDGVMLRAGGWKFV